MNFGLLLWPTTESSGEEPNLFEWYDNAKRKQNFVKVKWRLMSWMQAKLRQVMIKEKYIWAMTVMVHARSHSFQRTIKGRLRWSLRWWLPHHCSVPPLPLATLIGLISELRWNTSSTPIPPTKPAFLSLSLPTSTMCYLLQHNQSPTMLHTHSMFQANHIAHAPVLEVMSRSHHKNLRGFTLVSLGTLRNTSLLIICSFYYHMFFTLTPYMFMFCLCINTPIYCMYFASLNINLATYFSLTRSCLS